MPEPETLIAPTPPPGPSPSPLSAAPKSRFALARSTGWVITAAVLGLPILAGVWAISALRSEAGTAWLLQQVPGLQVTAASGSVLGERFGAERLRFTWADGKASAELEGVDLRGVRWRWWLRPGVWAGLQADTLTVRRISVNTGPPSADPLTPPETLRLPAEVQIARVDVGELQIDRQAPLRALSGAVHAGASGGTQHRISALSFEWDRLRGSGQGHIDSDTPFAFDTTLALQSVPGTDGKTEWTADVRAKGPLAGFDLQTTLRGQARTPGQEVPALDAQAHVLPFATWPLGTVNASTRALDLAAFSSQAPQTRLSGRAVITSQGLAAPVGAQVEFDNTLPGRWNEGRLPLRRVQIDLRANPAQRERLEIPTFDLLFGDASATAGRWAGSGAWQGSTLTLATRLTALRPQLLDGRAAAMQLSGPLAITLQGLPAPTAQATASANTPPVEVGFKGELDGTLEGLPRAVSLALEGSASAKGLDLRSLRATAGAASAELTASAQHEAGAAGPRWLLRSEGRLVDFDPVPWVPGPEGSTWRKGPHRLNATWKLDLSMPDSALRLPALQLVQTLQGEGTLQLDNSQLAGVPLKAQLQIGQDQAAPRAQRSRAQGELLLGSNRLTLDGRGDPSGSGETDRWRLALQAGALAELAPLVALEPDLANWAPRKGGADATVTAEGRWPLLQTEAEATLKDVQFGGLSVARGTAGWRLSTGRQEPIALQADLAGIAYGERRVAFLRGNVSGTLRAHRLQLEAAAPMSPHAVVERMLDLRTQAGTQAQVVAEGGWEADASGGGQWSGNVQRLTAGVWDGRTEPRVGANTATDASWVNVGAVRGEVQFSAEGSVLAAHAAAGSATLAGGGALRWNDIRYRAGGQQPDIQLQAEILPITVAPLLQRAQTGVQWAGDLRLGASIDIRAGERFDADVTVRRHDGDLSVIENGNTQALGLTDLSLSLTAHNGEWLVKPLLAGRALGTVSGAVTVRSTPQRRWPEAAAPIEGAVQVQVPSLAVWGRWVPPGWRIDGELSSTAGIGGRFGAPQYTGELRGSGLAVRNLLQGLEFSDGDLFIALKGERAVIERLSLRGGDGTLSAEGSATFGSAPSAQLKVTARQFRVLGRIDRQLVASGSATLALQPDRLRLDGKVGIDSGLFDLTRSDAPSLDDDVTVRRNGAAAPAKPEPTAVAPLARTAAVAVDIDLGDKLRLRGRGIDTQLKGQLRVSTPGGRLAVNGTVSAENGTYAAYGQKLEIERGLVAFAGPVDNPRLDILALRPNVDTRVGVAITGNAVTPRIRLYSEPEMSETDKLSWLVLGRGPDGLGRTDTALLQSAALALLAGEGEGPTDQVLRAIGIDDLSVRQTDGEVRETVISLGKQLSRRWYVGYERSVNATTGTWQLIYRVAQRFTLRAQSGQENSLDVIWTWRFGANPFAPAIAPAIAPAPAAAPSAVPASAPPRP